MSLVTAQMQRAFIEPRVPRVIYTTSDQTLIGTSYANVTGLSFALVAGKSYRFEFRIIADADASTTGIDVAVTAPSSPTRLVYSQYYPRSTGVWQFNGATADDANTANTGSGGTTPLEYVVAGEIVVGSSSGNLTARIKREAVGTGPNVRAGSCGFLWQLN